MLRAAGRHAGQRQQRAALGVRLRAAPLALHTHLRELYTETYTIHDDTVEYLYVTKILLTFYLHYDIF